MWCFLSANPRHQLPASMDRYRYVAAQDLSSLVIGDIAHEDGAWRWLNEPVEIAVAPEGYAAHILSHVDDCAGFIVVHTPGSATALRVSLSLVNAYAFTKNLPVVSVERPTDRPHADIVRELATAPAHRFAVPRYESGPKITAATHDNLKRKI